MKKQGYNPFRQGTFGDLTQYMRMGEIVLREAHNKSGFGIRTLAQMMHRLHLSNIIALWRVLASVLKTTITLREENQTVYNSFVQLNMPLCPVYMTKDEFRFGGSVLFNMVLSRGRLNPDIQLVWKQGVALSDIALGDLEITRQTTVGQFSAAVLENNDLAGKEPRFREDDCIKAYRLTQSTYAGTGLPYVSYQVCEVTLNKGDQTPLVEVAGGQDFLSYRGHLAARVPEGQMLAYIQTRRMSDGRVEVTTQMLVGKNPLLDSYCDTAAFERALETYGGLNHRNAAEPGDNAPKFDASKFTDSQFVISEDIDFGSFDEADSGEGSEEGGSEGSGSEGGGNNGGGNGGGQTPGTVDITVACADPASGTPYGGGQLTPGTEQQIGVTPNFNWNFIRWNDGDTHNPRTITVPTSNTTYTATLQLQDQQKSQPQQQ